MHNKAHEILSLLDSGNYSKAATECRKLIRKQGNSAENLSLMADVQQKQGKLNAAIKSYSSALAYANSDAVKAIIYYNLGFCYNLLGQYDRAIQAYQCALQNNPDLSLSAFNLANLLLQTGQTDEAINSFKTVLKSRDLEQKPQYQLEHKSYAALSRISRYACSEEDLNRIRMLLADKSLTTVEGEAHCCFALANFYDRQANFQQALTFYKQGNSIRMRMNPYKKEQYKKYVDSVTARFTRQVADSCQLEPEDSKNFQPVFILGMPRSGSTLVEYILSASRQVTALGELPDLSNACLSIDRQFTDMAPVYENLNRLSPVHIRHMREAYLAKIKSHDFNTPVFTDKMPENFAYLGFILLAFPEAKVIHTVRNPMAVLWSCFQTDFGGSQPFSNATDSLLDYYGAYKRLMRHWKQLFADRIYDIKYEDLVCDPGKQTARLMAFCGVTDDARELSTSQTSYRVKTASLDQVRQPVTDKALEKWKNYADFMRPVERGVARMDESLML